MAERFVADATKVVSLRLVKTEADLTDESRNFAPDYCHQFFGEHETIFGYDNLHVTLMCTFCGTHIYPSIKYSETSKAENFGSVVPDDIVGLIKKLYPENAILSDYDNFLKAVNEQHALKPFGELLHVYSADQNNKKREFCVYKIDSKSKNEFFIEFYQRIEMFAFWFIDAASCVDTSDDRWKFYVTYEKYLDSSKRVCYGFVGYSSVYMYYAYPEHLKPRIGHFLILPPFHKNGHGFQLLQTIYNDLVPNSKVLEIVAEDPAFNFVKLRDYVDATNCLKLQTFTPIEKLRLTGFSKELISEARQKLKIGKRQARRVYEILRLKATNISDATEYRAYRLDVKQRLYKPFKKSCKDWKNLNKVLTPEESASTAASMTRENVHLTLQSIFEQTMEEFRFVLDRLSTHHTLPEIVPAKMLGRIVEKNDRPETNGHVIS